MADPQREQLEALAQFRRGLRGFLRFSERTCADAGTTPAVYQLLQIVYVSRREADITIAANALQLTHQSAAELVGKASAAGFIDRRPDLDDARRTMLTLTEQGSRVLHQLAARHAAFLAGTRAELVAALERLGPHE